MADIERQCGNCHHFDLEGIDKTPFGTIDVTIDQAGTTRLCNMGVCRVNSGLKFSIQLDISSCKQSSEWFTPSVQASITNGIIFSSNELADVSDRSL